MNTLGIVLIMGGALLIWAGLTDNSIIELLKGITGNGSKPKGSKDAAAAGAGGGGGGHGGKH